MKTFALIIMLGISNIPLWSQVKGLVDYQRTKSYDEMDYNEGTRFYYKPNDMAYFGYSCYLFVEPDSNGNYLQIEDKCAISEKNIMDVYDELIRVLSENGLQIENFEKLTGTDDLSFENIYNAAIINSDAIYSYYKIGAANIYFTADNYSVELTIMDRKSRRTHNKGR